MKCIKGTEWWLWHLQKSVKLRVVPLNVNGRINPESRLISLMYKLYTWCTNHIAFRLLRKLFYCFFCYFQTESWQYHVWICTGMVWRSQGYTHSILAMNMIRVRVYQLNVTWQVSAKYKMIDHTEKLHQNYQKCGFDVNVCRKIFYVKSKMCLRHSWKH
mgnify:CR=1 FL=1